jgi:hypothetical protein
MSAHLAGPDPVESMPSPFRHAFSRARVEALTAGGLPIEELEELGEVRLAAAGPTWEYRLERRTGKRSADEAEWNAFGRDGWELVGVTAKHAAFKRRSG